MMTLADFLKDKPLYYKEFDPLRMRDAYESVRSELPLPKIIHVIGTNGKGSTGRYLAWMLMQAGMQVGHYTSPHISRFNERIWLNGEDVTDETLERAFHKLCAILDRRWQDALSYFEFTTLLAIVVFERADYVVLEAGLGGEHDATAVFENLLTVITPIGLDHQAFLGSTIEEVAATKLRAVKAKAVIAKQTNRKVYDVLAKQAKERGFETVVVEEGLLTPDDEALCRAFAKRVGVGYLGENFKTALVAFRTFFESKIDMQKVETIFGRLTKVRPNVTVDVGHNLLAAEKILDHFGKSKVNLVYNSLQDKEYEKILTLLQPIISKVEIIEISDERALKVSHLTHILDKLGLPYQYFREINEEKRYLVFGSFTVVEAFLKRVNV